MGVNDFPCLNDLNIPGLPDLEATPEQERFYRNFSTFDISVHEEILHLRVDKKALSGEYTGPSPVMVRIPGGGETLSDDDYGPWIRPHQEALHRPGMVIISPRNKLLPQNNWQQMMDAMGKFANCIKSMEDIEDAIKQQYPNMRASLQQQVFLLGESAGAGWAAALLWTHDDLDVGSCELYYPMAGPYEREAGIYRGYRPRHQDLVKSALRWFEAGAESRAQDLPGQPRTPPLGMGSMALNATWTRVKYGDETKLESMWTVLGQYCSFLELAKEIKKDVKIERRVAVLSDLVVEPSIIFQQLGDKLSNIGLKYLPEWDALEYIHPRVLPKVVKPRCPLVVVIQGTEDVNTPREDTQELVKCFRWAKTRVIYEEVNGASHGFDVPIKTAKMYDFDWERIHRAAVGPMEWSSDDM
ncbi:hypothetical protein SLS60_011920 [Paraconiothyrium brasiliense]|uniref:Alpha/beta hydrolase fold-3 domain-containing protein n=1 Tax=Paraconiothyrium brasiliense TaxID=300254 RepID=A0ABR3QHU5_9PLEO